MNLEYRNSDLMVAEVLDEVRKEVMRAVTMFKPMNSPHEAEAVIREEFEEYWDEVKAHNTFKNRDTRPRQREELIQLAAMAVRAIYDTIDNAKDRNRIPVEVSNPNLDEAGKLAD